MKKKDVISLVYWVVVFGGFIAYFFLVIRNHFGSSYFSNWFLYYLFVIIAIVVAIILNAILHEIAHIIGAKIGKYEIVSVNILHFCFYKQEKKTKFKFAKIDGLLGETKITPKEGCEKTAKPTSFIFTYTVFAFIEIVAFYFLFAFFFNSETALLSDLAYFAMDALITTAIIWVYDLIPVAMDNMTDGFRLSCYRKEGLIEFNKKLIESNGGNINALYDDGEETQKEKQEAGPTGNNEYTLFYYLGLEDYTNAEQIVDNMLADPHLSNKIALDIKSYKIFFKLNSASLEEGQTFYDTEVSLSERRDIGNCKSISKCLAYILMAGIYDKSYSETLVAIEKGQKIIKRENDQRKDILEKLLNAAIDKIRNQHPNWEL